MTILKGVNLNYAFFNFQKNRNLIIHHGLMGSHKNFRNICKNSSISSYMNSYLIDARNHGQSPHTSSHKMQDLADDLYRFIIDRKLSNKITLMGHSMGGLALMEFTKKYHQIQDIIDRVIIIDVPSTELNKYASYQNTKQMLGELAKINMSLSLQEINKEIDRIAISPAIAGLFKGEIHSDQHKRYWRVNLSILSTIGVEGIGNYRLEKDNHKKWKKPIDIIYGDKSGYFDSQQQKQFRTWYPQITDENFHKIQNSGHWVHFEQPQQFLSKMQRILQRDQ